MTARRILMTVDAVGGVWRYALDLAAELRRQGTRTVFLGFGPQPLPQQWHEAEAVGLVEWSDLPLDWTTREEAPLDAVPAAIRDCARRHDADLIHLNLPSQASGLDVDIPVVVVSHSCVVTWFAQVRGTCVPQGWGWHERRNREGLRRADLVLAPSRSHAQALWQAYGVEARVVHNASRFMPPLTGKEPFVFAAGRWWDEGKNGAVLDAAAAHTLWPVVMAGAVTGPDGQALRLRHARHAGSLGHGEAMAMMARAAVVVSPSLYEPFGLAALEGARAGAALVLADIPTYRELWDGVALFAGPRDPDAFSAAINRLADDSVLRQQLGAAAQARSLHFSPEAQGAAMARLYAGITPAAQLSAAE